MENGVLKYEKPFILPSKFMLYVLSYPENAYDNAMDKPTKGKLRRFQKTIGNFLKFGFFCYWNMKVDPF